MAAEVVNIPAHCIPEIFQRNMLEDFCLFLKIKATNGRFIEDAGIYPAKGLNRLVRRKWLVLHDGKYYQKKWVDVFPLQGMHTHAKIDVQALEDPTIFKAMLFLIGYAYLMSPQVPRKPKSRADDAAQVKESRHNGGISHSICMKHFGFKKTWCHNMRRLCERLGLAKWEARFVPVKLQPAHGTVPYVVAEQLMEGPGRFKIGKDNDVTEQVTSKFIAGVDVRLHIPYEYRSIVKQAYS